MPSPVGHALGVDFGTSHTVAVLRWPDGRARPLLVDGSPLLPSAVYAESDGTLIAGRDAVHSARIDPARFEPNPKRRIDDGTVLLGDREVPVPDLITAVLSRIAEECRRTIGEVTPTVTLTCPATWGATRRTLLREAAAKAGLPGARLVAEPVAATTYFAEVLGRDVPLGSVVVVHDFGAGTFDASVVVRRASGFEVLAVDGCDDVGGVDVDAALIDQLQAGYEARDPAAWARLTAPTTVEERRAKRQLWDDVRVAKERLSRAQRADLVLPLLDLEVHLTREELEERARPLLERTVRVTEGVMRWAGVAKDNVAGVFLVGGSSRIPLLATLLHRAIGEAPVVIEQPEMVVAEGSVLAEAALLLSAPAAPGPTALLPRMEPRKQPVPGVAAGGPAVSATPGATPGATPPAVAATQKLPSTTGPGATAASSPPAGPAAGSAPVDRTAVQPTSPAAPISPGSGGSPGQPSSGPTAGSGPTVGRVIVPGAQPPGRGRGVGSAPVVPTRQLPRVRGGPNATIPLPPGAAESRPAAKPNRPARDSQRVSSAPVRSPAARPQDARPQDARPQRARPRSARPVSRPPAPVYRPPRRPSGVLRFIRGVFIAGFLTTVPVVAGWVAYQVARNGF